MVHRLIACLALALIVTGVHAQPTGSSDAHRLADALENANARIAALEARVARMNAERGDDWLNDRQRREVRELIDEVLADADRRATLLADSATAGYDNGFFIQSPDEAFRLKIRGFIAARYVYNQRDTADDDSVSGFELARTRFGFMGHLFDPSLTFKIWTGDNAVGDNLLLDAWIKKSFDNGLSVKGGQFKLPFWREWLVSEVNLQFIERSLLNFASAGTYTQGVQVGYDHDRFRVVGAFTDGRDELNSTFDDDGAEYAFTSRAEVRLFGPWSGYKTFDSFRGDEPSLIIGVAGHLEESDPGNADKCGWTADVDWQLGGANLFAAVVGCDSDDPMDGDFIGFLVQGGVFVADPVELIARYEWADSDVPGVEDLSILTAGVNYFFYKWNVRATLDVGYAFNEVSARWASSSAGYLGDDSAQTGQVVVRSQVQLLF